MIPPYEGSGGCGDYDVTPSIIAHFYLQMRKGSANSARCIVEMGDCWRRECA